MTDRYDSPARDLCPQIWEYTLPAPNATCGGCPKESLTGHASCAGYRADPAHPPADLQRLSTGQLRKLQEGVWIRDRSTGWYYGSTPGFQYNARDSFNYADSVSAEIISVDGNQITLDFGIDPKGMVLWAARISGEIGYINGVAGFGPIQPGMGIEFLNPSILEAKSRPNIKRILAFSGTQATYLLDQDVSAALTSNDPDVSPPSYGVKVWNDFGNKQNWLEIQPPTYMRAKQKMVAVRASHLLENKIYRLSEKGVAFSGFEMPVFWIEAYNTDTGVWDNLGGTDRLFTRTQTDGSKSADVAFGTEKPADANNAGAPFGTDLTATYERFRVHYWEESATGCSAPCYTRCKWARRDYTNSVGAAGGNGIGVDTNGNHWFCHWRHWKDAEIQDNFDVISDFPNAIPGSDGYPDTMVYNDEYATGAVRFPANGQCDQGNTCNRREASENDASNSGFFDAQLHPGRVLVELWGSSNTMLRQKFVSLNDSSAWEVLRILHPGLWWISTGFLESNRSNLQPREAYHVRHLFIHSTDFKGGAWSTGYDTYTDEDGNTFLRDLWTHNWDYTVDSEGVVTIADGRIASVSGLKPSRDSYDPANTTSENEIERLGIRVVRDTGEIQARGLAFWSKTLPAGQFIVPLCPTAVPDEETVYDRQTVTWERLTELIDFFGGHTFDAGGVIGIKALRQPTKTPVSIGARQIVGTPVVDGNEIICELGNVRHSWTYQAGPMFEDEKIWYAGGGAPIYPHDYNLIDSVSEPDKTMGSPAGGAIRGDSVGLSLSGLATWRFLLSTVTPFGGSEAPDWGGDKIISNTISVPGFFQASSTNTLISGSKYGHIKAPATGDMVKEGSTVYTRLSGLMRPASIANHQYWVDEVNNQIYYSQANDGATVTNRYGVTDKVGDFTESYNIDTTPDNATGISYADAAAATDTEVIYADTGATVLSYTTSNVGGTLHVVFSGNDAGKRIIIRFTKTGVPKESPGDGVTIVPNNGYTSYAKQRDLVRLVDESGTLALRLAELEGATITFYKGDGVYNPDGLTVEWTEYQKDEWALMTPGTDYLSIHGLGRIYVSEAFLTGKPDSICYRINGKMVDNRGLVSASLINKTQHALDALKWVRTFPAYTGVSYGVYAIGGWTYAGTYFTSGPCVDKLSGFPGTYDTTQREVHFEISGAETHNIISSGYESTHLLEPASADASIDILGTSFGQLDVFKYLPDTWSVAEAVIEVTSPFVSFDKTIIEMTPLDPIGFDTVETHEYEAPDMTYIVLAIKRDGSAEVIGDFPAPPNSHDDPVTGVFNATSVVQAMWARKRDDSTLGYVVIMGLGANSASDIGGYLDSLRQPQPGAMHTFATGCPQQYYPHWESWNLRWSNPTINQVRVKFTVPDAGALDVVVPIMPLLN